MIRLQSYRGLAGGGREAGGWNTVHLRGPSWRLVLVQNLNLVRFWSTVFRVRVSSCCYSTDSTVLNPKRGSTHELPLVVHHRHCTPAAFSEREVKVLLVLFHYCMLPSVERQFCEDIIILIAPGEKNYNKSSAKKKSSLSVSLFINLSVRGNVPASHHHDSALATGNGIAQVHSS